jgi:DNA-binding LytR/AlgR family response regulator
MRGYMQIVTETQVFFVHNTIQEVEKSLPPALFCRIHRSYIVSTNRIQAFDDFKIVLTPAPEGKTYFGLAKETVFPVGRTYRKKIRDSVTIIPNRMNKNVNKILAEAEFQYEYGSDYGEK